MSDRYSIHSSDAEEEPEAPDNETRAKAMNELIDLLQELRGRRTIERAQRRMEALMAMRDAHRIITTLLENIHAQLADHPELADLLFVDRGRAITLYSNVIHECEDHRTGDFTLTEMRDASTQTDPPPVEETAPVPSNLMDCTPSECEELILPGGSSTSDDLI